MDAFPSGSVLIGMLVVIAGLVVPLAMNNEVHQLQLMLAMGIAGLAAMLLGISEMLRSILIKLQNSKQSLEEDSADPDSSPTN